MSNYLAFDLLPIGTFAAPPRTVAADAVAAAPAAVLHAPERVQRAAEDLVAALVLLARDEAHAARVPLLHLAPTTC